MLKLNGQLPIKKILLKVNLLVALMISALSVSQSFAGAWVAKEGSGYGKFSYTSYSADDFYGETPNFGEFKGLNTAYYGEYGLGSNWGVYGQLLFQELEQTDATGVRTKSSGLGDAELGVRRQFTTDFAVYATSFLIKLPYFYDTDSAFARGDGEEDYEARFLMGKSLYPYGYFGVELGYRLRTSDASDEYRYLLEYGISANDHLYFRTKLDGVLSVGNGTVTTALDGSNLSITPEYDLGKWELTGGWSFAADSKGQKWGVELTYTNEVYGENTLKGQSVQIALTRVF
jgi:protein XagA